VRTPQHVDTTLDLDLDESEAVALAEELHADRILLDDWNARRVAAARGLTVVGTLAILVVAHQSDLLNLKQAVEELRKTTFYVDEALLSAILARVAGT
jgi:predicted nucleic acid-binding protein